MISILWRSWLLYNWMWWMVRGLLCMWICLVEGWLGQGLKNWGWEVNAGRHVVSVVSYTFTYFTMTSCSTGSKGAQTPFCTQIFALGNCWKAFFKRLIFERNVIYSILSIQIFHDHIVRKAWRLANCHWFGFSDLKLHWIFALWLQLVSLSQKLRASNDTCDRSWMWILS